MQQVWRRRVLLAQATTVTLASVLASSARGYVPGVAARPLSLDASVAARTLVPAGTIGQTPAVATERWVDAESAGVPDTLISSSGDEEMYQAFLHEAGGVLHSHSDYGSLDKQRHFWDFFLEPGHGEFLDMHTIYAGRPGDNRNTATIRDLLETPRLRSIEHIMLKSRLRDAMQADEWPKSAVFGARINPHNMAASLRRVNTRYRHTRLFDLDGDPIAAGGVIDVDRFAFEHAGIDADNEFVVPLISRGDVARACLYMTLVYRLPLFKPHELVILRAWALRDPPSRFEAAFNAWLVARDAAGRTRKYRGTLGVVQNPLVLYPAMLQCRFINPLLRAAIGNPLPNCSDAEPGTQDPGSVGIASLLVNPTGRDAALTELIGIENTADVPRHVDASWHVVVRHASRPPQRWDLPAYTLAPHSVTQFAFPVANALPNVRSKRVDVDLVRNQQVLASVHYQRDHDNVQG